jgi:hypothetical protein
MKYSKAGILKKKVGPASEILQEEAKRMEERLSELKDFMLKEREKRDTAPRMKDGSKWRSSATSKPITGYADFVLSKKPKLSQKPKPSQEDLKNFLLSCGLEKYLKLFKDQGIEDLEILQEVTETHLQDMGIPIGHRLKLLKKLKEAKEPKSQEPLPETLQGKNSSKDLGIQLEEPFEPLQDLEHVEMFREALESFSKSGSATKLKARAKAAEDPPKKVRFLEPVTEEMLPKHVKGLVQEDSWASRDLKVTDTFEESSATSGPVIIKEKRSCWNCYKIFEASSVVFSLDKQFCGNGCCEKYQKSRMVSCVCGNKFFKDSGVIEAAQWVCSNECAQKVLKEVQENEENLKNLEEMSENEEFEDEDENEHIFIDPATGDQIVR